jgi:hypothetical protein
MYAVYYRTRILANINWQSFLRLKATPTVRLGEKNSAVAYQVYSLWVMRCRG